MFQMPPYYSQVETEEKLVVVKSIKRWFLKLLYTLC